MQGQKEQSKQGCPKKQANLRRVRVGPGQFKTNKLWSDMWRKQQINMFRWRGLWTFRDTTKQSIMEGNPRGAKIENQDLPPGLKFPSENVV